VDSICGIAVAEFAAAFVIAAASAKLRAIERGEQSATTGLARDRGQSVLCADRAGGGVLCAVSNAGSGASIRIAN
jgi:hypothetical protein